MLVRSGIGVRQCFYIAKRFTSKKARSVLLQDTEALITHEFPIDGRKRHRVYAWGLSETGALGIQTSLKKQAQRYTAIVPHPTRLQFAENTEVTDIATGYGFSVFAVKRSDGETLFGTGINSDSQLGLQMKSVGGTRKPLELLIYPSAIHLPKKPDDTEGSLEVKSVGAGRAHLAVVTKNGSVFTLGNNSYGQCGRPIVKDERYLESGVIHRIDKLVGDDDDVESVECGQDHTLFLTRRGRVLSCGWGADGQTGLGHFRSTSEICEVGGEIKGEKIVKVSSTGDCVLALSEKGEVFGWGNTEYGQLVDMEEGTPQICNPTLLKLTKNLGRIIDIAAGGSFCMVLNEAGQVFTWGYGILGFGPNVEQSSVPKKLLEPLFGRNDFNTECKVVSICCGLFHMGAINTDGDLFMWGKNRFGCLGLGHKKDQFFPFKTAVNGKVIKASFGIDHTLALCKSFY